MNVIPGQFVANGHDYRKDLARFTSLAYDLPVDEERLERIERVLRQRELQWAERRLVSEQFAQAQAQLTEQLAKWGVPKDVVPTVVAPQPDAASDPYAAVEDCRIRAAPVDLGEDPATRPTRAPEPFARRLSDPDRHHDHEWEDGREGQGRSPLPRRTGPSARTRQASEAMRPASARSASA